MDARTYVLQDANYNVTAVVALGSGDIERFVYDPYGKRTVLDVDWVATSDAFDWKQGHQGGFGF